MARPKKTGHKSHDKVMEQDWRAKQGHNLGGVNPEVQNLFAEDEKLENNIKALQKDRKAIRVRAKEEFGIPLRVWSMEKSMRKLDVNVRAEVEQAHADLKMMTGYQMALNLIPPIPKAAQDPVTAASKKVANINRNESSSLPIPDSMGDEELHDDDFAA